METTLSTFWKNLTVSPADYLVNFGSKLLGAIIVLILGTLVIKALSSLASGTLRRTVHDSTVRSYALSAITITLWVLLVIILLSVFGIETLAFTAIIGAVTLVIGLALQGSLSNFAAGFMILLFRPFKAGDEIEVAGVTGTVIEISVFNTIIDMPDKVRAFVPNGTIFHGVIKNRSVSDHLRLDLKITVPADADITRVQQVIQRLLMTNDLVLEVPRPEVQVVVDEGPGITIGVRPYAKLAHIDSVRTTVTREIREELHRAGITVVR